MLLSEEGNNSLLEAIMKKILMHMSSSSILESNSMSASQISCRYLVCTSSSSCKPIKSLKADRALHASWFVCRDNSSPLSGMPNACLTAKGLICITLSLLRTNTIVSGSSLSYKYFNISLLTSLSVRIWRRPLKFILLILVRWLMVRRSINELKIEGAHRTVGA